MVSGILSYASSSWTSTNNNNNNPQVVKVFNISGKLPSGSDNNMLPAAFIQMTWSKCYSIAHLAAAAATDFSSSPDDDGDEVGRIAIVMNLHLTPQGQPIYPQQSLSVSEDKFPYTWVLKKWAQGHSLTTMTTMNGISSEGREGGRGRRTWVVVMTTEEETNDDNGNGNGNGGTRIVDQKIEIDYRYPAEAVRMRWNEGYLASHVAANSEECVVCMTRPVGGYGGGGGGVFP
jgi:hypothetical protein